MNKKRKLDFLDQTSDSKTEKKIKKKKEKKEDGIKIHLFCPETDQMAFI